MGPAETAGFIATCAFVGALEAGVAWLLFKEWRGLRRAKAKTTTIGSIRVTIKQDAAEAIALDVARRIKAAQN